MEIVPSLVPAALLTIPFLVTVVAMHAILFKPLFEYLDERDHVSHKARHDADEMNAAADEKLSAIERQLTAIRKEATELRQAARAKAHEGETEILAEARKHAESKVAGALQELAGARTTAAATLRGAASLLSNDIAAQVLGRRTT